MNYILPIFLFTKAYGKLNTCTNKNSLLSVNHKQHLINIKFAHQAVEHQGTNYLLIMQLSNNYLYVDLNQVQN